MAGHASAHMVRQSNGMSAARQVREDGRFFATAQNDMFSNSTLERNVSVTALAQHVILRKPPCLPAVQGGADIPVCRPKPERRSGMPECGHLRLHGQAKPAQETHASAHMGQ